MLIWWNNNRFERSGDLKERAVFHQRIAATLVVEGLKYFMSSASVLQQLLGRTEGIRRFSALTTPATVQSLYSATSLEFLIYFCEGDFYTHHYVVEFSRNERLGIM